MSIASRVRRGRRHHRSRPAPLERRQLIHCDPSCRRKAQARGDIIDWSTRWASDSQASTRKKGHGLTVWRPEVPFDPTRALEPSRSSKSGFQLQSSLVCWGRPRERTPADDRPARATPTQMLTALGLDSNCVRGPAGTTGSQMVRAATATARVSSAAATMKRISYRPTFGGSVAAGWCSTGRSWSSTSRASATDARDSWQGRCSPAIRDHGAAADSSRSTSAVVPERKICACRVLPSNARQPVTMKSVAPNARMSVRSSVIAVSICSGAIYGRVPWKCPRTLFVGSNDDSSMETGSGRSAARPKSSSLIARC